MTQATAGGCISGGTFACALTFAATAAAMNGAFLSGVLSRWGGRGAALWQFWQAFLGCMGPAMVAQALAVAILPASNSTWPAAAGATAAAIITATLANADSEGGRTSDRDSVRNSSVAGASHGRAEMHNDTTIENKKDSHGKEGHVRYYSWVPFWATVPAWSATVLLMLGPATLLVRHSYTYNK